MFDWLNSEICLVRSKEFPLKPQRHIDESNERRHLDQGANDCGKCCPGVDSENRDGDRNRQLKIVTRGSE